MEGREERERVARVYTGYGQDPRKQRAWSAENSGNRAIREEVLRTLFELAGGELRSGGTVLDAGCGTGWWLRRLVQEGLAPAHLAGVDVLAERAQAAAERLPGARIVEGDLRALPLADASCTVVLLFTVLSAMGSRQDVAGALAEVRRVLAPRGVVAIWEPRVPTANRHTRMVGLGELREGLGVEIEAVRSLTLAPPLARRTGRLYGPLARVPLLRTHRLVMVRR